MSRGRLLVLALALAVSGSPRAATPPAAPPPALTAEQQTSLRELDVELARFEALCATVEDPGYRGTLKGTLDGFKDRRHPLRTVFDQMVYDELRLAVLAEHQRVLLWLAPPKLPPRKTPSRPAAPAK